MTSQNKSSSNKKQSHVALTFGRRGFLGLGATIGAGFVLPDILGCGSDDPKPTPNGATNPELFTPAVVRAEGGLLDIEMTITETEVTVGGYTFTTRAYTSLKLNAGKASFSGGAYTGTIPGPSIEVRPGDKFKMKLINALPNDSSTVDPPANCDHSHEDDMPLGHVAGTHNNTTNFHTHGLHISPSSGSDDVLMRIEPGESFDFVFDIPQNLVMPDGTMANHPAGTYWYHPHVHGATALQVAGGMVGAILIRDEANDDLDTMFSPNPTPEQGKEQLLVIGELILNTKDPCNGKTRLATYEEMGHAGPLPPGVVEFLYVNGQVNPIIRMRPSEVQRFRVLHTGFRAPLDVAFIRVPDDQVDPATSLPKPGYTPFNYSCVSMGGPPMLNRDVTRAKSVPFYQVATDGITYDAPLKMPMENAVDEVEFLIPPGGRADLLVQFEAGTYQMVTLGYLDIVCWDPEVLATVIVSGEPDTRLQIPQTLTPPALYPPFDDAMKPGNQVTNKREVKFKVSPNPTNPNRAIFTVDGKWFCDGRVDQCIELDAVEEWTIVNESGQIGEFVHPFHIHVNSFLVTSINGKSPARRTWRDTFFLPKRSDGINANFVFLSRFLHFTGQYVLHCHILEHEDEGMMQLVQVEPAAACEAPPPPEMCPTPPLPMP